MRACLKSPYSAASAAFALILRGLRLTGQRACAPQSTVSHVKIDAFATKGDFKQALSYPARSPRPRMLTRFLRVEIEEWGRIRIWKANGYVCVLLRNAGCRAVTATRRTLKFFPDSGYHQQRE